MRHGCALALAAFVAGAALLAGCSSTPVQEQQQVQEPAAPEEEPVAEEGGDPRYPFEMTEDLQCLIGEWTLDLGAFSDDVWVWLAGELGAPLLDDLTVVGHGYLEFTADGIIGIDNDLRTVGTIDPPRGPSVPYDVTGIYVATGDFYPGGEENTFDVEHWSAVTVVPGEEEGTNPSLFDMSASSGLEFDCSAHDLRLPPGGAPYPLYYYR